MADSKFDMARSALGNEIRQLRLKKGFLQADLADKCDVQRTTINMIEQGKRNPSMELLRSLVANLASTPDEKHRIIYASIGDNPEQAPPTYLQLTQQLPPSDVNLWIFSDALAETRWVEDNPWLEKTIEDICEGKDRYYFLPEGKCLFQKNLFLGALKRSNIAEDTYSQRVKFFSLREPFPALICFLRLAVIYPPHRSVDPAFFSVELEAEKRVRVPLSPDLATPIVQGLDELCKAIDQDPKNEYLGIRKIELDSA